MWQIPQQSQDRNSIASFTAWKVQVEKDYLRRPVVGRREQSYCQFSGILNKKYYSNVIEDFGRTGRGKCDLVFPELK